MFDFDFIALESTNKLITLLTKIQSLYPWKFSMSSLDANTTITLNHSSNSKSKLINKFPKVNKHKKNLEKKPLVNLAIEIRTFFPLVLRCVNNAIYIFSIVFTRLR